MLKEMGPTLSKMDCGDASIRIQIPFLPAPMLILPHLASIPASCSCFISLLLFLSRSWCQVGTTAEHCGGVRHGALDEAANDALPRNSSIPGGDGWQRGRETHKSAQVFS